MRKNALMKTLFILTILILTVVLPLNFSVAAKTLPTAKTEIAGNLDDDEREIFDLINRERQKKNLNNLKWRGDLARMARNYAEKMARERFFSHYDKSGAGVVNRAKDSKIKNWKKIGENLFYIEGMKDFKSFIVKKWMQSSPHRANILDREYNAAGLGIAESRDGTIYITQVFVEE